MIEGERKPVKLRKEKTHLLLGRKLLESLMQNYDAKYSCLGQSRQNSKSDVRLGSHFSRFSRVGRVETRLSRFW